MMFSEHDGMKRMLVSVKSGHVTVDHVRALRGTVERERAAMGILVTLEDATRPIRQEATAAGYYESGLWGKAYPKIQIATIRELLIGKSRSCRRRRPPATSAPNGYGRGTRSSSGSWPAFEIERTPRTKGHSVASSDRKGAPTASTEAAAFVPERRPLTRDRLLEALGKGDQVSIGEIGNALGDGTITREELFELRPELKDMVRTAADIAERTKISLDSILKSSGLADYLRTHESLASAFNQMNKSGLTDYLRTQASLTSAIDEMKRSAERMRTFALSPLPKQTEFVAPPPHPEVDALYDVREEIAGLAAIAAETAGQIKSQAEIASAALEAVGRLETHVQAIVQESSQLRGTFASGQRVAERLTWVLVVLTVLLVLLGVPVAIVTIPQTLKIFGL